MAGRLLLTIQQKFDQMTPAEKRLARLLAEDEGAILTSSATELAQRAGISKATAARFFQRLGYVDFNEVKLQAREEKNREAPSDLSPPRGPAQALGRSLAQHLELETDNLSRSFEEMGSANLRRSIELLAEAPRVWIAGQGAEVEGIALYARLLLARLRHEVHLLGGHPAQFAEDLAMVAPRDLLLAFCLPPYAEMTFRLLDHARGSRMQVIILADRGGLMELSRYADVFLPCHVASYALGASPTAFLSLSRLLATGLAERVGLQRASIIGHLRRELG